MSTVASQSKIDAFTENHPGIADWLIANQLKSNFARSLLLQVRDRGMLTERQQDAVKKIIADNKKNAEVAAAREAKPALDIARLEATFQVAKDRGVKKPMLRLGDFKFKVADPFGNNAGAIWVTTLAKNEFGETRYLGKIKDGRFLPTRDTTAAEIEAIEKAASNPSDAAKAYGQRTGMCCVCGRTLTNGESIDAMIGPICAEKYGF